MAIKTMKTKLFNLDTWFEDLNRNDRFIHDIIEYDSTDYVIWSDEKGYSVSWKSQHGCGTSGIFDDIIEAVNYIKNI